MSIKDKFKQAYKEKNRHFLYIRYDKWRKYKWLLKFLLLFNKNFNSVEIFRKEYKTHGRVVIFGLRWYGKNVKRRTNGFAKNFLRKNPNSKCPYCDEPMTFKNATVDHIIQICKGGTNAQVNFLVCCSQCNGERGDEDYLKYLKKKNPKKSKFI